MAGTPVLGPVAFGGFEVPEQISLGGKQKLVVHMLPGGDRVVDTMGPDDAPIRWSGVFSGQGAAERVRTLERLRRGGTVLLLSWDAWRFSVIIQQFTAEVTNACWIPYQIELCVVPPDAVVQDWLKNVAQPALSVAELTGAALDQQIEVAGIGLTSSSLGDAVAASGQLAQLVTERAYGGLSL